MSELQRGALGRGISRTLLGLGLGDLRIVDRLVVRLEQLRSLSWTRHGGDVDRMFHLVTTWGGSVATRCDGRWPESDPSETLPEGPPLHLICGECARRWARGKDLELYGLLELARDLATEDLIRAEPHEAARLEMTGGGS